MNIYCPRGLHMGVFQGLDGSMCNHTFYVKGWQGESKKQPSNVIVMSQEMLENPDDSFFGAILGQSLEDYYSISQYDKPILFYQLMNGRGSLTKPFNHSFILENKNVIPIYISASCRTSHGHFDGLHKTIYPGIDENYFNGWTGEEQKIVHVRNDFKNRDPQKFAEFEYVSDGNPYMMIGQSGNMYCNEPQMLEQFRKHRLFLNIEIFTSTFSIASMEAMMTGMPIICNDIESTGEAIRNGVEGYISNNLDFLKKKTRDLLNDHAMAKELGNNAREMAKIKFGKKQFNMAWNDLLDNLDYYKRK